MTPSGQRGVGRRVDAAEAPAVVVEDRRRADAHAAYDKFLPTPYAPTPTITNIGHNIDGTPDCNLT